MYRSILLFVLCGKLFFIDVCIYAQYQNSLILRLEDGEYHMTYSEMEMLKGASETFRQDLKELNKDEVLNLTQISQNTFTLIIQLIKHQDDESEMRSLLKKEYKMTINQLYDLYKQLIFLDIQPLYIFIKQQIEILINNESYEKIKKIKTDNEEEFFKGKDPWFVDAIRQKIGISHEIKPNMYNFFFADGSSSKPLSEKKQIDALINFSELLKTYIADTKDIHLKNPLYLLGMNKEDFEKVYRLVDFLDNKSRLLKVISNYTVNDLSALLVAADYLAISSLISIATDYLAKKLISQVTLENVEVGHSLLNLSSYLDHSVAREIAYQSNLVGQAYLLRAIPAFTNRIISHVVWSPDEKLFATVSYMGTSKIWNTQSWELVYTITAHTTTIASIAFSPDGKTFITGSHDGTAKIWDTSDWQLKHSLVDQMGPINCVAYDFDGKKIAVGSSNGTLKVWDAQTGQLKFNFIESSPVVLIAWSPNGKRIAAGFGNDLIKIWNIENGQLITTFTGHTNTLTSLVWSLDDTKVASASWDTTAQVWDVSTGNSIHTLSAHTNSVECLALSPDGKMLATGGIDTSVILWDLQKGTALHILKDHTSWVKQIAWSPDSTMLATGSFDKTVIIWNVKTGKKICTLVQHTEPIRSLAWSPGGTLLAVGSADGTASIWRIIGRNDLLDLTIDQAMFILLVEKSKKDQRKISMDRQLKDIFQTLNDHLQQLLIKRFNVKYA